jgi:4-amino-4-deoxy-L-arabinose transferase-like glycosyltransferase
MLGAFGAGIAFSTKGQIALVVMGFPLLCHLAYTRNWKRFLSWKVLVALIVFTLTIIPMLYAYYHQFDLHPEKIIRGKGERSGLFFIFWEQSMERMSGEGMGKNSSDYFFFFHTFLWVFLPWTILGVDAYWTQLKTFFKLKFKSNPKQEFLTLGGITFIFLVISFAQFKLPHYLNITMPLFAVLTASYLHNLYRNSKKKSIKVMLGVQYFVLCLFFITLMLICFYVFKIESYYDYLLPGIGIAIIIYFCLKREDYYYRIITLSVCVTLLLNAVLNTHFYPELLKYQAGSSMAQTIAEENIPVDNIYKVSTRYSWTLDFYNQSPVKITTMDAIKGQNNIWIYADDLQLKELQNLGFDWDKQYSEDQFRITRLQGKFLDPATRKKVLNRMHLIHIY